MATVQAAMFWITMYFSVGPSATRLLVSADAAPLRVLWKAGEAEISALFIAAPIAPMGGIVFAMFSEAFMVAVTKLRKPVFVW